MRLTIEMDVAQLLLAHVEIGAVHFGRSDTGANAHGP